MTEAIRATIGCDLGDKTSTLYLVEDGPTGERVERPPAIKTTMEAFRQFFTRPAAHVVIEAGTHSRWVSRLLKELGHRVTVANPRRVQLIAQDVRKSDDQDPELLARLGRSDSKLLAPIQHRTDSAHFDLELVKARDQLVRARTQLVLHVRSVVKASGATRLPKCQAECFHRRTKDLLPKELRAALLPLYGVLQTLEDKIKSYEKQVERLAKKHPDIEVVSQPDGVGAITAAAFLLTLEDKQRFKSSRNVPAFLGLVPRRDQSGEIDRELPITRAGPPLVRRLLVQSASYILGPFGKDSDLKRWGMALASKGGKNAKKRARVAVARKLSVLMHRLWVTGEIYQPLGYGRRAAAAT